MHCLFVCLFSKCFLTDQAMFICRCVHNEIMMNVKFPLVFPEQDGKQSGFSRRVRLRLFAQVITGGEARLWLVTLPTADGSPPLMSFIFHELFLVRSDELRKKSEYYSSSRFRA
ncbi:uncharacterized protein V6R79_022480 [Siganus canaliculatus]